MQFDFIDFVIGFLLMNAMPHFVFGITKVKFPSLFGFGYRANILSSLVNFFTSILLFEMKYGVQSIGSHGIFLGALLVFMVYCANGLLLWGAFEKSKE